jgi:N-acetylmuramoyl-L-alanine amidase
MTFRAALAVRFFAVLFAGLASRAQADISVSTSSAVPLSTTPSQGLLTVVHPLEGMKLPAIPQTFVFGAVSPGSTVTINGNQVPVHPKGGYLAMAPLRPGEFIYTVEAKTPLGETLRVDRKVFVSPGFVISPANPLTIEKTSVAPFDDLWLVPGDSLRVLFQGSPGASASFSIEDVAKDLPMVEQGTFAAKGVVALSSTAARGIYEGFYVVQPGDKAKAAAIEVTLKRGKDTRKQKAPGKVLIEPAGTPRVALVTEDTVAARTGPEGGYDLFLFRGMRVRLTGKVGSQWRVGFSSVQSGWVKESALQEQPRGVPPPQTALTNFSVVRQEESTIVRVPMSEVLPYRAEQFLEPTRLVVTLFGAVNKTDLIRYDPLDALVRQVRWRQIAPDTVQLTIDTTFDRWWGYDIRYEGTTLMIEIRKPWTSKELRGMVIAVDPGHGGGDTGAAGPHGTLEKDANLQIAQVVKQVLERAGARPFLTREKDVEVPLYERPRMAWNRNARLFISVHCNASGVAENPVWNNGFSIYSYQPQSHAFAQALHASYLKNMNLPDHGLYYADLAVCRMTQMPSVLTEQAYMIVPEQEDLIFSPEFQRRVAVSILNGVRAFIAEP